MELGDLVLVYNGETYNHEALRAGLGGDYRSTRTRKPSSTSTASTATGVSAISPGCSPSPSGIGVAGGSSRPAIGLGIKPFQYWVRGDQLAFASELKALLEIGVPAIDRTAIRDLFTYRHIPTPKTIYRDLRKLPPAHTLVWQDGRVEIERYWPPP